jgi:hypothetical protein
LIGIRWKKPVEKGLLGCEQEAGMGSILGNLSAFNRSLIEASLDPMAMIAKINGSLSGRITSGTENSLPVKPLAHIAKGRRRGQGFNG